MTLWHGAPNVLIRPWSETETFEFGFETETFFETLHTSMFKGYYTTLTSYVHAFILNVIDQ